MTWNLRTGDVRTVLATLEPESVQTCITSPPYWGLRDYGTATWDGGDPECDHVQRMARGDAGRCSDDERPGNINPAPVETPIGFRDICGKCGATRIDSQIGLEPTPEEYVANLVSVFREVRRVLRADGTLWLNLGDSYHGGGGGNYGDSKSTRTHAEHLTNVRNRIDLDGLKPKDLVGIPWAVAFALRADGWYLRSDIIWAKPNPMPESVTDRPTKAHEYLFLLTKNPRYFYDADAIREEPVGTDGGNGRGLVMADRNDGGPPPQAANPAGRNKRSVWTVSTQPFPGAHFATFPPKLIEPCILAGSPPKCCGECGAPWEKIIETNNPSKQAWDSDSRGWSDPNHTNAQSSKSLHRQPGGVYSTAEVVGSRPTCAHSDDSGQALVLDPFAGAGTTLLVAEQQGRDSIGIELNPEYAQLARDRLANWDVNRNGYLTGDPEPLPGQGSLL